MGLRWVRLVNFATLWEAESLVEQLRSAGLHAVTKGKDIVGIVGPGFSGAIARGTDVMVTSDGVADAQEILAAFRGTPKNDEANKHRD
jgi:uncharacterized protein (DUF697 family)